jgi:hypothetical protein
MALTDIKDRPDMEHLERRRKTSLSSREAHYCVFARSRPESAELTAASGAAVSLQRQ